MKYIFICFMFLAVGCYRTTTQTDALIGIQIQDRNGLNETISNPDRLTVYENVDFLTSQPYQKVLRVYKLEGKNHSKITTYHPNGSIWQYLEAEEMRAHGAYQEWFPNGQLKISAIVIGGTADLSIGTQHDWLFDGLSYVWDERGQVVATMSYDKGVLEGLSTYFYPNGQIARILPFEKNVQEGVAIGYFNEGQKAWEEEYKEGLINKAIYYDPRGEIVSEINNGGGFQALYEDKKVVLTEYRMGRPDGMVKKFSASGKLERSYTIKNKKKQGEELEFYPESQQKKLLIEWNENIVNGVVKTWYPNGQLQSEREYHQNLKSGPVLAWYPDSPLMMVEEYEADCLKTGHYYKKNQREPISTVQKGNGIATLFDETGTLLKKVTYLNGKPVDP